MSSANAASAESDSSELTELARALAVVLAPGGSDPIDLDALEPLLHEDVVWGECRNRRDVIALLERWSGPDRSEGPPVDQFEVAALHGAGDRIIVELELDDDTIHLALIAAGGKILQILDAPDADTARTLQPLTGIVPESSDDLSTARFERIASVFPVSNLERAVDHYILLGFKVRVFEGEAAYAFADRDGFEFHLTRVSDLDPLANQSAVYVFVDDADALYQEWRGRGVAGHLIAPTDTDYGLREGAHVDPDGNLMRFGSEIT